MDPHLLATKVCRHGIFTYLRTDSFIGRSLDLYGEWGEGEIILFRRLLQTGSVVIDVGANIQLRTAAGASRYSAPSTAPAAAQYVITFVKPLAAMLMRLPHTESGLQQRQQFRSCSGRGRWDRSASDDDRRFAVAKT
jgi:hypothetical protein